jgi:hypothetical protein
LDDHLRSGPPDPVPIDRGALLSVACVALGGTAWLAAVLIAWAPYAVGDLAAILFRSGSVRPGLVAAYVLVLLSTALLGVAALRLGRSSRRRIRGGAGSLRGGRIAWVAMASAVVLLLLLAALALATIVVTQTEYASMAECARQGGCINP